MSQEASAGVDRGRAGGKEGRRGEGQHLSPGFSSHPYTLFAPPPSTDPPFFFFLFPFRSCRRLVPSAPLTVLLPSAELGKSWRV